MSQRCQPRCGVIKFELGVQCFKQKLNVQKACHILFYYFGFEMYVERDFTHLNWMYT